MQLTPYLLAFSVFFCANSALASRPIPVKDTEIYSANHEYVVKLHPTASLAVFGVCHGESTAYKASNLQNKLWSVPTYVASSKITNDGRVFINVIPVAGKLPDIVLTFFRDGKPTKSHSYSEFCIKDAPVSMVGGGHILWLDRGLDSCSFSADETQTFVRLNDRRTAVFKTETGELQTIEPAAK